MKNFFNSNPCTIEKTLEIGNHTFYLRKMKFGEDNTFEYHLLDSIHSRLAYYAAKLETTEIGEFVLHITDGFVKSLDTKENMRNLSVLLAEGFVDLDDTAGKAKIIVDADPSKNHYTKFQHACMRFDDACLGTMIHHINHHDSTQREIEIERNRVLKWFHLNEYFNSKNWGEGLEK